MAGQGINSEPKLPVQQLAILAICRFAEPVVLTSVYPYIPEMIESFGIEKDQIPKWAGITSAAFSVSQSATAILWGRASDRFGRKPAIITGLTCTMICSIVWGFSSNLAMAITARAIQGAFNGNVGTIRTMVAEMVPEKELQPTAFSIMPLVWSLGSIFGPSFGGFFAKPAEHLPGLFGHNAFFIKFPFALPNILASGLFLIGIGTAILYLRETHHAMRDRTDHGLILGKKLTQFYCSLVSLPFKMSSTPRASPAPVTSGETRPLTPSSASSGKHAPSKRESRPTLVQVFTWQSTLNLLAYAFLAMHSVAYDQLVPIFMHMPARDASAPPPQLPFKFSGGFGLESSRIGTIFTIYGIFGGLVQFLIFPPAARRFGVVNCFKACAVAFPLIYLVTPYTALIRSSLWQQVVILVVMIFKCVTVIFAFPCSIILLTNSAKSLNVLGTLNGFAVSFSSIGRAIGPAVGGLAFTWGLDNDYVIAPWWLLSFLAMIGGLLIWQLEECEGFATANTPAVKDVDSESEREGQPLLARESVKSQTDRFVAADGEEEEVGVPRGHYGSTSA